MSLETATYINGLVSTNPTATDNKSEGDDHIRLIKSTLLATFPSITGPVTATHTELNILDGVTASAAELNILDGVTATATELNLLDGITAIAAGTWTPTLTNGLNVASSSANTSYYVRLSNVVVCGGHLTVDPTAASTATYVSLTLPVSSGFTLSTDAFGGGSWSVNNVPVGLKVYADAAVDLITLSFVPDSDASGVVSFIAAYVVK